MNTVYPGFIHDFGKDAEGSESDPSDEDGSLVEGDDEDEDTDVVMENQEVDEADDDENHDVQESEVEWHGFGNGSTKEDEEESNDGSSIVENEIKVDVTKTSRPMPSGLCPAAA